MLLSTALELADHASPPPQLAADALTTLRRAYIEAAGIASDARVVRQLGSFAGAALRTLRFPAELSTADYASAFTILADGRRNSITVGRCSLHIDPDAGVIWGFGPDGREVIAGKSLNAAGAGAALEWALARA